MNRTNRTIFRFAANAETLAALPGHDAYMSLRNDALVSYDVDWETGVADGHLAFTKQALHAMLDTPGLAFSVLGMTMGAGSATPTGGIIEDGSF
ncbi:MAG: hypothetical protein ACLKAN_13075 [Alkaliphilus sp.]